MGDVSFVLSTAITYLLDPIHLLFIAGGTVFGLIFGCLPGLSATMGVALMIPMTYSMDSAIALGVMIGVYVGGIAGGAISATLINIPGTPSSVVTSLDGYPMAKKGQGARALGWAAFASGWGSMVSWVLLIFLSTYLAKVCTAFGSPEYAALAFFGLAVIAAVSGKSMTKGIIAGLLGVSLSFVGVDPIWGTMRFTYNNINLMSGISTIPAMIGLYSIPQLLISCTDKTRDEKVVTRIRDIVPPLREQWAQKVNIVRSALIGVVIGMVPAAGGNIAAFISYDWAKRFSKEPDTFGHGNVEGVIASEASNNGVCGGALIPLLTLGIPGDSVTAVLLGALMIHGLRPGSALFIEKPDVIVGLFTAFLIATIFMVLFQVVGVKFFVKVLNVPVHYLIPALMVLSLVGSFAIRNSYFDVILTLVIGTAGYLLKKGGFPTAPIVLGLVLGSMFEGEIRRAMKLSGGSMSIFFTNPVSCVIILVAVAIIGFNVYKAAREAILSAKK